ncbi:MAG: DEAD/DEAH box helicase [Oculatellaceae cyanobacterium Prado106]|nr:DEAD/DEAH box helicase [Oculatellaceae cyanobacterium Prado106]
MKILHGTWIPQPETDFIQGGAFYLWVETEAAIAPPPSKRKKASSATPSHPYHLNETALATFLEQELGIKPPATGRAPASLESTIAHRHFLMPSAAGEPLPSLELSRYLETELPETFEWQYWPIACFPTTTRLENQPVETVIKLLNDLHFIALYDLTEVQFGSDLLFWYHYTQFFKQIILRDQYIPALRYREIAAATPKAAAKTATKSTTSGRKTTSTARTTKKTAESTRAIAPQFEIYSGWEIISDRYETELQRYVEWMPLACVAGFAEPPEAPQFYDRTTLLQHFSECLLHQIVTSTAIPATFEKKIFGTLIDDCLHQRRVTTSAGLDQYQQWQTWRDRISRNQAAGSFYLCFQLQSPDRPEQPWTLEFQVAPRQDPSARLSLGDYWRSPPTRQKQLLKSFGSHFDQHLLTQLGYAARIYPKIWQGLETHEPAEISLSLDEAFQFLQEAAWILEEAGYKVIVPAWWTPKGRQRAKIRLKAKSSGQKAPGKVSSGYFSKDSLVSYEYELAIGGERVSEQEWQALVNAKTPLVQFRGEWMELDQDKMEEMLNFWKKHQQENPELSLADFMKLTAEGETNEQLEVDHDQTLSEMLDKLRDQSQLELITDPAGFQGKLRDYQKRGVSWINYLETLGLNGCLADDMGLGKSAQVIARLLQERTPTLLIAPTSVVGNWQKEIEKFAPQLRSLVHHGNQRLQDPKAFQQAVQDCDVLITSFSLARKDEKLLGSIDWHRLVVDEAQNIKNPKAAQTKAILKLPARHRLALTGTPVENRLLDLWSIFNFLNPGYLGKESQFRQSFEIPIQKHSDRARSTTLKKLVEPFILRRVKTDQSIIQDLPDKVEQKLYCNLTKEQASLYEAVVQEVEKNIQSSEGIQRKGLILSTLLKLKQICNHPRQFLQDGSEFTPERSHKLERLTAMIEEVKAEGESLLIFTQFTELGDALEKYIKHTLRYNTYYIHGGTDRNKRERMIEEFQDPDSEPSVFILSLKAGGVGITLTRANHVFHFDRWWNPAVEDQATDRAFRIGQKKNVFVHKFVAIGTLEERIDQMIEDKKKLAGAIIGADESWLTELDNEAFKKLIQLNRSAVLE